MPQLQIYDDRPTENTGPLAGLGKSFADQLTKNISGQREQDAVQKMFNAYKDDSTTIEDVYGQLLGNPRISQQNQSNISNVLKNLEEKKISKSKEFKIAQFLSTNDLSGKSSKEVTRMAIDAGVGSKAALEIGEKLGQKDNTNTLNQQDRDYVSDLLRKVNAGELSPREAQADLIANVSDKRLIDKASDLISGKGAKKSKGLLSKNMEKRASQISEEGEKARVALQNAPDLKAAIEGLEDESNWISQFVSAVPGGSELAERAFSDNQQTISSIIKNNLLKSGDLKGLRLTDTKLRFMQQAHPSPYKSREANEAAYKIWLREQELKSDTLEAQQQLIAELEEQGYEQLPSNYDKLLADKMEELGLNDVLDDIVEDARQLVEGQKKDKPKKVTKKLAQEYIQQANGDKDLARQMAREDGYEF